MRCPPERGVTLTEILVAMALAVIVVAGVSITDATRGRIEQDIRGKAGPRIAQIAPAMAIQRLAKQMAQADRIKILDSGIPGGQGRMRIRRVACGEPVGSACFSDSSKFHWDEYRLNGSTLESFTDVTNGGCGAATVLAGNIVSVTFQFVDGQGAFPNPPCEPFGAGVPQDNNVVGYTLTWSEGSLQHQFVGETTSRLIPCSNLSATFDVPTQTGDSGVGLAAAGVSVPPTIVCP